MNYINTIIAIILATLMSGCANLGSLSEQGQQLQLTTYNPQEKVEEAGALAIWPPYASAAVIDGKGNRCVLAASGAKTIDASSEAALRLGKALEKIEGLDASIKSSIAESFTKTTAADAHAAFADVSLFHLCILDQNGTFGIDEKTGKQKEKASQLLGAYLKTIEAAKSIGK